MSRLKRIAFITISMMVLLTSICYGKDWKENPDNISVENVKVGDKLSVELNWAHQHADFFCVAHDQHFNNSWLKLKAISKVSIVGNTATDNRGKSKTADYNGVIAYELSKSDGNGGFHWFKDNGDKKVDRVQWLMYKDIYSWIEKVGKYLNTNLKGFSKLPKDKIEDYSQIIHNEAVEYAKNLPSETKFENKTNRKLLTISEYVKDGKSYLKVGPLKYSFGGNLTKLELTDDKGKTLPIQGYVKYEGKKLKEVSGLKNIKSNQEFYVIISNNSGLSTIKKIKATEEHKELATDIVFWKNTESKYVQYQNIIQFNTSNKTITTEDVFDTEIPLLIDISGKVWEDNLGGKDNNYEAYGKDVYANGDILVEGITVRLKDKNGKTIKETKTDKKGEYKFKDLTISELGNYTVEYEYDGFTYTTVQPLVGKDVTVNSKASEIVDQRKKLNGAFAIITNYDDNDRSAGYNRDANANIKGNLKYTNDTNERTSTYVSTTYNNETYSGTNLTANTKVTGFDLSKQKREVNSDGKLEIKNVNLGLRRREQPNISIRNDLSKVKVQVNGYGTTYDGDSEGNKYGTWTDAERTNMKVKFGSEYGSYYREIYPSDIKYSSELSDAEDARKLKVYATYIVTITNNSNSLSMAVPEIVNYYDSNFEIVADGTEFPEGLLDGVKILKVNGKDYEKVLAHTDTAGETYGVSKISLADTPKIEAGKVLTLEITYKVKDETVLSLLNGGEKPLNNVVEVNAYSTYYASEIEGCKTGEVYAGIDKNSAPGNATPGVLETYEDDTDAAPIFKLTAKGVRQIEGTVFEDGTGTSDVQTGAERKGNGLFDESERTVSGVKVELLKVTGEGTENATYYPDEIGDDGTVTSNKEASTAPYETVKDGRYIFKGIEPDKYLIKYTYENGTTKICDTEGNTIDVNVQDYKSTTITSQTIRKAFESEEKNTTKEPDNMTWYEEAEKRYSDARDDYGTRNAIDNELKEIKGKADITQTSLFANTPKFEIPLEYKSIITDASDNKFIHKISNIDFGISKRPQQAVALDKEVSYIIVTLANGQKIVDGDPRTEELDYVAVTRDGNNKIEQIEIILDSELLHGAHLELQYEFTVANNSEKDYIDKDGMISKSYYYYGDVGADDTEVTLTSAQIIDYVDSQMVLQEGQGDTWKVTDLVTDGINWGLDEDQKKALLNSYNTLVIAKPISDGTAVKPGQKQSTPIIVEKIIGNTEKDLVYSNNGEVVTISKTGGSNLTTTLASYAKLLASNPGADPIGTDETKAEKVTIVPPFGATDNTTLYATISVISLAVLGAGIYGTRRFLIKK